MKKHAGRPKGGTKAGETVKPHIGGMETLGPLPVNAGAFKGKKGKSR